MITIGFDIELNTIIKIITYLGFFFIGWIISTTELTFKSFRTYLLIAIVSIMCASYIFFQ